MSSEQSADQVDGASGVDDSMTWEIVPKTVNVIDEIDLVSSDEDIENVKEVTTLKSACCAPQLNPGENEAFQAIYKEEDIPTDFKHMNFSKELLQGIRAVGLQKLTPLQQKAMIPCLKGHDVIMHAPQRAGKKTALALSVLQMVDTNLPHCQVLILISSKQEAENMMTILHDLGCYGNFQCNVCIDSKHTYVIETGVHIVIGTLASVRNLISSKNLRTDYIRIVCFECEFNLSPNVPRIFKLLKPEVQVIVISTVGSEKSPSRPRKRKKIAVHEDAKKISLENIERIYQPIISNFKFQDIFEHHSKMTVSQCAVFYNKSSGPDAIEENKELGILVSSHHHGKDDLEERITHARSLPDHRVVKTSIMPRVSAVQDSDYPPVPGIRRTQFSCSEGRSVDFVKKHQILQDVSNSSLNGIHDCNVDTYGGIVSNNFSMLNLHEKLLGGIYTCGLERPTPLQQKAITHCILGYDVVIHGFPKSGKKTAAAVVALQNIRSDLKCCQVLILMSNNEAALCIWKLLVQLGHYMKVQCHLLNHKNTFNENFLKQKMTSHIIVGTPIKVYDVIKQKTLSIDHITLLVLEEAHTIVSKGVEKSTCDLLNTFNSGTQKMFLSNFMPTEKQKIFRSFLTNPVCLLPVIRQIFIPVAKGHLKLETLYKMYKTYSITKAVIFCNSNHTVDCLTTYMLSRGFKVSALHSGVSKSKRRSVRRKFSTLCDHTLVTDFVLHDVQDVPVIINYDVLVLKKHYKHQITMYLKATIISLVCEHENEILQRIECLNKTNSITSQVCGEL